jgi:heme/copper-type cytochrome/quinol oxidase subunit 3
MATTATSTTSPSANGPVEVFRDAPPPAPERPRVLLVGTALASAAAAAAILGMVALYTQVRAQQLGAGEGWIPEDSIIPLTPGNMAMVSLLMSAVTVAWAMYALRGHDRTHALLALGLTLMFGIAFVTDTAYLWQQMNLGIRDSAAAVLIYAITGAHVAMVGGGLLFLLVMGFRALGGQVTGRAAEGLSAAALFWYVTIGVYSVVWYAIYITK